jgi:hypothetical protein
VSKAGSTSVFEELLPPKIARPRTATTGGICVNATPKVGLFVLPRSRHCRRDMALARTMDSTRSVNQKPAAGKLADILDGLRQGGGVRRSRLAVVRTMSESAGPTSPARLGGLGAVRGAAGSRPSAMPRTPVGR